jgi:DNA-binding transcriptional ArsR family regulator
MVALSDDEKLAMIERWDTVFQALAAEPRRQVVVALLESDPDSALSLPEAANPSYMRFGPEQLSLELVHVHLPLLADGGFVEWEREPFAVERGPAFEEAAIVFESLYDNVDDIPAQLRTSCQRLEERHRGGDGE